MKIVRCLASAGETVQTIQRPDGASYPVQGAIQNAYRIGDAPFEAER